MWLKIKLAAAALVVGMVYYIKLLSSKNARLEHKNKVHNKINEIRENQEKFKEKVLSNEKESINDKVKNKPDNLDDYLDGL